MVSRRRSHDTAWDTAWARVADASSGRELARQGRNAKVERERLEPHHAPARRACGGQRGRTAVPLPRSGPMADWDGRGAPRPRADVAARRCDATAEGADSAAVQRVDPARVAWAWAAGLAWLTHSWLTHSWLTAGPCGPAIIARDGEEPADYPAKYTTEYTAEYTARSGRGRARHFQRRFYVSSRAQEASVRRRREPVREHVAAPDCHLSRSIAAVTYRC